MKPTGAGKADSFADKVVLVTGGAAGIGRATALAFGRAGAALAIADIDVAGGEETSRLVRETGAEAHFIKADVGAAAEVEALVGAIVARYGRLDCAFNNAGIDEESGATADCDEVKWDRVFRVNLKGVWLCMKYELLHMLSRGRGTIVNAGSVAGLTGAPMFAAYSASKHGVVGLTRTAAAEYGMRGIRINAVCPGVVHTPMLDRFLSMAPEMKGELEKLHPMGRFGQPEEVADAVLWLSSDASSFVTGHALAIDGGFVAV